MPVLALCSEWRFTGNGATPAQAWIFPLGKERDRRRGHAHTAALHLLDELVDRGLPVGRRFALRFGGHAPEHLRSTWHRNRPSGSRRAHGGSHQSDQGATATCDRPCERIVAGLRIRSTLEAESGRIAIGRPVLTVRRGVVTAMNGEAVGSGGASYVEDGRVATAVS